MVMEMKPDLKLVPQLPIELTPELAIDPQQDIGVAGETPMVEATAAPFSEEVKEKFAMVEDPDVETWVINMPGNKTTELRCKTYSQAWAVLIMTSMPLVITLPGVSAFIIKRMEKKGFSIHKKKFIIS